MWIWVSSQSSFQLWWPIVVHIRKRKDMGPQSLYCYGIITDHESMSYEMKNGINKWNIMTHINTKLFAWVKSVISISGPFWPCTILNALQVVVPRFRNQWTCHSVNKNHKKLCPFIDPCLVLRESMTGNYLRPKYFPRDSLVNSISRRTPWPTLFEHLLPDKDPKRRTMVDKPRIYGRSPTLS